MSISTSSATPHKIVPITSLRRLYNLLRDTSSQFHSALASEFILKPSLVHDLVKDSLAHFSHYQNLHEGFHNRSHHGTPSERCRSSPNPPQRLVTLLCSDLERLESSTSPDAGEFSFEYVDHEVCPNRTTGRARFDDGVRARRGSSVDLLLRSKHDQFPAICEVKMATRNKPDTNTFFALIQGLMYSVELLTANQRSRLLNNYGKRLSIPEQGPYADLVMILIGHDIAHSKVRTTLHRQAEQLVRILMEKPNAVSELLRRIVCIDAQLPETAEEGIRWNLLFASSEADRQPSTAMTRY